IPFGRNVTAGEIVDQVVDLNTRSLDGHGRMLSNIVYMGMGEPLANYDEVVRSIRRITSEDGLAMSPRRITLSTAGLVPQIRRLADEHLGIHLAISLHSAVSETRRSMMSSARTFDLAEIADAVRYWRQSTGEIVTFEYLLLSGVNDTQVERDALIRYASGLPCKINLIEYNAVTGIPFSGTEEGAIDEFARALRAADIAVTVRHSRGKDIDAACGQLAARKIG
ncbi:MAG: 23S rRNA (adenine(2503)-C(2))-methyltransferase RlmN, partial [bacterium]